MWINGMFGCSSSLEYQLVRGKRLRRHHGENEYDYDRGSRIGRSCSSQSEVKDVLQTGTVSGWVLRVTNERSR